jgi:hypothetical protein
LSEEKNTQEDTSSRESTLTRKLKEIQAKVRKEYAKQKRIFKEGKGKAQDETHH